ncbi:MAG: hypothetical protein IIY93_06635 [Clostridia bacterium]|nr:hypothetical protein [Clostridia bacterium]
MKNMKNRDILLDVIGDTDEKLIPELSTKRKPNRILKWAAVGGVCAAAVIACVMVFPKISKDKPFYTVRGNATVLAAAEYPEMPAYPDADSDPDGTLYDAWGEARTALRNQPEGYQDGFNDFFLSSTGVFLNKSSTDNQAYSPLSLYMALGMSAEITDGNSRQQILDALHQSDIKTLRSHSQSIWQANYADDGLAKCVLANSLWTNNRMRYKKDTVGRLADTYYSSVFSGEPGSDEYNKMLQDWINQQTDGLLEDYASNVEMDPRMVLTLASTVNYSGKWKDPFMSNDTKTSTFHAASGNIKCDFMNAERDTFYYWGDHFSSVSLPLKNNGHMKLILPNKGYTPADLLNDKQVRKLLVSYGDYPNSKSAMVTLSIPKFDVSSTMNLGDGLNALGITDIFDPEKSDFTPLTDSTDEIYLSKAEQNTRVLIDEEGCKAASVTVIMLEGMGASIEHEKFILDRPFLFEIMSETGLPLFVGIVNNPC